MIGLTPLLTLLDSVASGALMFETAMGLDAVTADTVAKAAANDVLTVIATGDEDAEADLLPTLRRRVAFLPAGVLWRVLGGQNVWQAIEAHVGGLDAFLRAHNARVSPLVREIGFPLSAACLMPPVVDPMGTVAVSAPGQSAYTHVADIDPQYGAAWLAVMATAPVGVTDLVATVSGLQMDSVTPVQIAVTLPGGSMSGTAVNVGTLGVAGNAINYLRGVTVSGGNAGDAFKIVSRVERVIPATS